MYYFFILSSSRAVCCSCCIIRNGFTYKQDNAFGQSNKEERLIFENANKSIKLDESNGNDIHFRRDFRVFHKEAARPTFVLGVSGLVCGFIVMTS
jgi:hypothetical protein